MNYFLFELLPVPEGAVCVWNPVMKVDYNLQRTWCSYYPAVLYGVKKLSINTFGPSQMYSSTSTIQPECCSIRCFRAYQEALIRCCVLDLNVHFVGPLTEELEPSSFLEDVRSLMSVTFLIKLRTVSLTSTAVSPLWNLRANHYSMYRHLLSLFFQDRENLGELIEAAKLEWNSYVRTRVDGELKSNLQWILFWIELVPF